MNEVKILVLVGMSGAGKSTCVDHLSGKGYPKVYFGGIVVEETKRRYGGITSEELEKIVREDLRAKEGNLAIANRIISQIDQLIADGETRIIADGLYSWSEYKLFKERFGNNAVIIAVAADRQARHERIAKRPVRPLNEQEVTAREYAEIENIEKGGPIANADYTITNDTSQEELLQKLDSVLLQAGF